MSHAPTVLNSLSLYDRATLIARVLGIVLMHSTDTKPGELLVTDTLVIIHPEDVK